MVESGDFLVYTISMMLWITLVEIGVGAIAFYVADWINEHTKIPNWLVDLVVLILAIIASYFIVSCLTIGFSLI